MFIISVKVVVLTVHRKEFIDISKSNRYFGQFERNAQIFGSASVSLDLLLDKIRFLASIGCSLNGCFQRVSLTDLYRDWAAVAHYYS